MFGFAPQRTRKSRAQKQTTLNDATHARFGSSPSNAKALNSSTIAALIPNKQIKRDDENDDDGKSQSKSSCPGFADRTTTEKRVSRINSLLMTTTTNNAKKMSSSQNNSAVNIQRQRAQSTLPTITQQSRYLQKRPVVLSTTTATTTSSNAAIARTQQQQQQRAINVQQQKRNTNGRQTAPPIAPKLKPREPARHNNNNTSSSSLTTTSAQQKKQLERRTKTPSLVSVSLLKKVSAITTTSTSTVFGRQNTQSGGAIVTQKQRQQTIATSEPEIEQSLKEKIEQTKSARRKRTICAEALSDIARKSNLFRGRLEIIHNVFINTRQNDVDDDHDHDEESKKNDTAEEKCSYCAVTKETIGKLEDSLRIEKLERSNIKRECINAKNEGKDLKADVIQLGKIIARVFRGEIVPYELKDIAGRFNDEAVQSQSDDDDCDKWTPLPKSSQYYGLPVEEISWGRTLTPRKMSPGYAVPRLDFSLIKRTNSNTDDDDDDAGNDYECSNSNSSNSDDDDDDDEVEDDEDEEDDEEVDRWINS